MKPEEARPLPADNCSNGMVLLVVFVATIISLAGAGLYATAVLDRIAVFLATP